MPFVDEKSPMVGVERDDDTKLEVSRGGPFTKVEDAMFPLRIVQGEVSDGEMCVPQVKVSGGDLSPYVPSSLRMWGPSGVLSAYIRGVSSGRRGAVALAVSPLHGRVIPEPR